MKIKMKSEIKKTKSTMCELENAMEEVLSMKCRDGK